MAGEPVIEPGLFHITRADQLHCDPVLPLVSINVHGQVAHLSGPHKPMALKEPDEEIPAKAGPETTQQRGKCQVKDAIEYHCIQEVLWARIVELEMHFLKSVKRVPSKASFEIRISSLQHGSRVEEEEVAQL